MYIHSYLWKFWSGLVSRAEAGQNGDVQRIREMTKSYAWYGMGVVAWGRAGGGVVPPNTRNEVFQVIKLMHVPRGPWCARQNGPWPG